MTIDRSKRASVEELLKVLLLRDPFMSVAEARRQVAEVTGVDAGTIKTWINRGQILAGTEWSRQPRATRRGRADCVPAPPGVDPPKLPGDGMPVGATWDTSPYVDDWDTFPRVIGARMKVLAEGEHTKVVSTTKLPNYSPNEASHLGYVIAKTYASLVVGHWTTGTISKLAELHRSARTLQFARFATQPPGLDRRPQAADELTIHRAITVGKKSTHAALPNRPLLVLVRSQPFTDTELAQRHREEVTLAATPFPGDDSGSKYLLYRHYDGAGNLLYIGQTVRPIWKRTHDHSKDKPWFHRVRRIEVEERSDQADLDRAEQRAIKTEHPLHNVAHSALASKAPLTTREINRLYAGYFADLVQKSA